MSSQLQWATNNQRMSSQFCHNWHHSICTPIFLLLTVSCIGHNLQVVVRNKEFECIHKKLLFFIFYALYFIFFMFLCWEVYFLLDWHVFCISYYISLELKGLRVTIQKEFYYTKGTFFSCVCNIKNYKRDSKSLLGFNECFHFC